MMFLTFQNIKQNRAVFQVKNVTTEEARYINIEVNHYSAANIIYLGFTYIIKALSRHKSVFNIQNGSIP